MSMGVHQVIRAGALLLGFSWGLVLVLGGLAAFRWWASDATGAGWSFWIGVLGLASGNFVFMEIVANRVAPQGRRGGGATDAVQFAAASVILLSMIMSVMSWADGSTL